MKIYGNKKFYLASNSERRINILNNIGLDFEAVGNSFEEIISEENPVDFVVNSSINKINSIKSEIKTGFIVGCDTIIYFNGRIIGKPENKGDAFNTLKLLSGKKHDVISGISILDVENNELYSDFSSTKVYFKKLSTDEINDYISTREYIGKAGSYAIQGKASIFVDKIEGCFYNVVGFPVSVFYDLLKKSIKD